MAIPLDVNLLNKYLFINLKIPAEKQMKHWQCFVVSAIGNDSKETRRKKMLCDFLEAVVRKCWSEWVFLKISQISQWTPTWVVLCEICEIFKDTIFYRTPPAAATANKYFSLSFNSLKFSILIVYRNTWLRKILIIDLTKKTVHNVFTITTNLQGRVL